MFTAISDVKRTVFKKNSKYITLAVETELLKPLSKVKFLHIARGHGYNRICRKCGRLKSQHAKNMKCLFGPNYRAR